MSRRRETPAIRWECPDCASIVVNGASCPGCGYTPKTAAVIGPNAPLEVAETWRPTGPPPCTPEQNAAAGRIVRAVLNGTMTAEEGDTAIRKLFGTGV